MKFILNEKHKILVNEFATFRVGFVLSNLIMWSFYQILLYKTTGSLQVIIVEALIFYISLGVGFILGAVILDSIGYLRSMRLMYILSLFPIAGVLIWMNDLESLFVTIAVLRGLPRGIYWAIHHSFFLKELHGSERSISINLFKSLELILSIVIPIFVGSLIVLEDGYSLVFLIGGFMYLSLLFFPWKYNKVPESKVTMKEITRITQSKHFGLFALINMFEAGIDAMFGMMFLILPFLFIGDEFGVGTLMSFIAFVGAITAFLERKKSFKFRFELGVFGYIIRSVMNIVLALVWSLPVLAIRGMVVVVTSSTSDTVREDLGNINKELLLRDFKNESAAEINIITEIIFMIGRIVTFVPIIVIMQEATDPEYFFRIFIGFFAFYKVISLVLQERLQRILKI